MEFPGVTALLDTGFLLAVLDADDKYHDVSSLALDEESQPALPDVVLPELAYLTQRELGSSALAEFLRFVAKGELTIERTQTSDLSRAADLLEQYADNHIDFVDCVIVAIAERLNITRIMTLDRRHFSIVRPKHCPVFEIVP
jgi:hypothetical protein